MQSIMTGYRGFVLLLSLNWDRLLYGGTIAVALALGSWFGSHYTQVIY